MSQTYVVVYRTGGTDRCVWHRTESYATRADADACRERVERQGYQALVTDDAKSMAIGLPEGWEAS